MKRVLTYCWIIALTLAQLVSSAQCPSPRLYDLNLAIASSSPVWLHCIDNQTDPEAFKLELVSPANILNYSINWGDGSPVQTGATWNAGSIIAHTYTQLGTFTVTVRETRNGCTTTITGKLVNDRKPGATAIPPTTNSSGCAPHSLTFINKTTNVSPFTRFIWEWGDGTRTNVTNPAQAGSVDKPITHVYQKGTSGCDMQVRLTAISLCDTSFVVYGPYNMWDTDTANVTASATQLCVGDTVTFTDATNYNCIAGTRRIKWDFSSLGGPITGWVPAIPSNQTKRVYVSGTVGQTYTVTFADSNFCGVDDAAVTIQIVAPPVAKMSTLKSTVCINENVTINNTSVGGNRFVWNWGDGTPNTTATNTSSMSHAYKTAGTYTVTLTASMAGSNVCRSTSTLVITVNPGPSPKFTTSISEACGRLTTTFTDQSINTVTRLWNFGNGNTSTSSGPFTYTYSQPGNYIISLEGKDNIGCTSFFTDTVYVYAVPEVSIVADSVCFGQQMLMVNNTTLSPSKTGSIRMDRFNSINGSNVSNLTSSPKFPNKPDQTAYLSLFESPSNTGDNYGSKIFGYIYPPENGSYIFWIASDDNSQLWLSSDENPANKTQIAFVTGNTSPRQWTKYTSQQSNTIQLVAGRKYYIEVLHKEGGGNDNLAVGWQLPSGTLERPISGNRLSPFQEGEFITNWSWNFGNGTGSSTLKSPSYTYPASGTYSVNLVANTSKCSGSNSTTAFVAPKVTAKVLVSDSMSCNPLKMLVTQKTTNASKLFINFGDGNRDTLLPSIKDTLSYSYFNNTSLNKSFMFSAVAVGAIGCRDTIQKTFTVYPSPKAIFDVQVPTPPCSPYLASISNNSISNDTNFVWRVNSGNSFISSSKTFKLPFTNTSSIVAFDTIKLQAISKNGCVSSFEKTVIVFPEPKYSIISNLDTVCSPSQIRFSIPQTATSYAWDFGNGQVSFSATPNVSFENNSTSDTTYSVRAIASSVYSCKDTAYKNITVKAPLKAAIQAAPLIQTFPASTVNFTNKSKGDVDSYKWNFGNGKTNTSTSPVAHTYDTAGVYTVQLSVKNHYCSDSVKETITILPRKAIASFTGSGKGCAPLKTSFTNTSLYAKNHLWDFGDGFNSTMQNPSHRYQQPGIYTVKLIAFGYDGSADTAIATAAVEVIPNPVKASFALTDTAGCHPFSTTITNTTLGATSLEWRYGNGNSDVYNSGTSHSITQSYSNTGMITRAYRIALYAYGNLGCSDSVFKQVYVYPVPKADFQISVPSPACAPFDARLINTSVSNDTLFAWKIGSNPSFNNASSSFYQNVVNTSDLIRYDTITLTSSNKEGCYTTKQRVMSVFPTPNYSINASKDTACSPMMVNFSVNSPALSYVWDMGDGSRSVSASPSVMYTTNTDKTISVKALITSYFGCKDTVFTTLGIKAPITADFVATPSIQFLPNSTVSLSQLSSGNITQFNWFFGNGKTSQLANPTSVNYDSAGFYTISLSVNNAYCKDSSSQLVQIRPRLPEANFSGSDTACAPVKVSFINTSKYAVRYLWSFGDGNTSTELNPTHVYDKVGKYSVSLVVYNQEGIADTLIKSNQIHVLAPPRANFAIVPPVQRFPNSTISIINNSIGQINTYAWYIGNTLFSNQNTPSPYDLKQPGEYQVKLYVSNSFKGCVDSAVRIARIQQLLPKAAFTGTHKGCPPLRAAFKNTSQNAKKYRWKFGDGTESTEMEPSYTYDKPGNYTVTLVAEGEDGSIDSVRQMVIEVLKSTVQASIELSDTSGCHPFNPTIKNGSNGSIASRWDFGNGNDAQFNTPGHPPIRQVYPNPSNASKIYSIKLVTQGQFGCRDSVVKQVTVHPVPKPSFNVSSPSPACAPFEARIINQSISSDTIYEWKVGKNASFKRSDERFDYLMINNGNQIRYDTIVLKASTKHGCAAISSRVTPVYPSANYEMIATDDTACSPMPVQFSVNKPALFYFWDFGQGAKSIDDNPSLVYQTNRDTVYKVKAVVTSYFGCVDTVSKPIGVKAPIQANFIVDPLVQTYPAATIQLTQASKGNISSFNWLFGDDSTTTNPDPRLHTYDTSGYFTVVLKVQNEYCEDTITQRIRIKPRLPESLFRGSDTACIPVKVSFENQSRYATDYIWDFGDGTKTTDKNPIHTYNKAGEYTVKLVSFNEEGESDTVVVNKTVVALNPPTTDFNVSPVSQRFPNTIINFENKSKGTIDAYTWNIAGIDTSSKNTPNPFDLKKEGAYTITLTTSNKYAGCADTLSKTVNILPPLPKASFEGGDTACAPLTVSFKNTSKYANEYYWDFGDESASSKLNPTHTYTEAGVYTVKLIAKSSQGVDSVTYQGIVVVKEKLNAQFEVTPLKVVYPNTTININNTTSGDSIKYVWSFGDGQTSTTKDPIKYSYDTTGSYYVKLNVTNRWEGCAHEDSVRISVLAPPPVASFESPSSGCAPHSVTFKNISIRATSYIWDFGDGTTSTLANPTHFYPAPGNYTVKLTALSESGSDEEIVYGAVKVFENPVAGFSTNYSVGQDIVAPAKVIFSNVSLYANSYTWVIGNGDTLSDANITYTFTQPGLYNTKLIALNEFGCRDTFEIFPPITVIEKGDLFIPNAFRPELSTNGNDVFKPVINNYDIITSFKMQIFNRWGEMLYEGTEARTAAWDGMYKGNLSSQDVYIYKIEVSFNSGNKETFVGDVTLIR